jgi:hypothetical protein
LYGWHYFSRFISLIKSSYNLLKKLNCKMFMLDATNMNIFILSINPKEAAQAHGDKHVIKMILESCQMLYSAHWFCGSSLEDAPTAKNGQRGYKAAHMNHPCTKWVRHSRENYVWTTHLAIALVEEYEYRWPGRIHSCKEHAIWLRANVPALACNRTDILCSSYG